MTKLEELILKEIKNKAPGQLIILCKEKESWMNREFLSILLNANLMDGFFHICILYTRDCPRVGFSSDVKKDEDQIIMSLTKFKAKYSLSGT